MSSAYRAPVLAEEDELRAEIAEVVLYPDAWLDTPNDQLAGQTPRELLRTSRGRDVLHNLVQSIKHGMTT